MVHLFILVANILVSGSTINYRKNFRVNVYETCAMYGLAAKDDTNTDKKRCAY